MNLVGRVREVVDAVPDPAIDRMYREVASLLARSGVDVRLPSPEHQLESPTLHSGRSAAVWIKRDDLISPLFPGNKFRKLVPHIHRLGEEGHQRVVTFGGAYSNHLYAFASAARILQIEAIACVRGERVEPLNPVLRYVEDSGVHLRFVDRSTYRRRHDPTMLRQLETEVGSFYLVPEGGTEAIAVRSVARLASEVRQTVDVVVTAVGTGGTLAGLAQGFGRRAKVVGVSSLRGAASLDDEVRALTGEALNNWTIAHDHHFGGFARTTPDLWEFMTAVEEETGLRFDAVYTAKALAALRDLIQVSPPTTRFLFVHTGGVPIDTRHALLQQRR